MYVWRSSAPSFDIGSPDRGIAVLQYHGVPAMVCVEAICGTAGFIIRPPSKSHDTVAYRQALHRHIDSTLRGMHGVPTGSAFGRSSSSASDSLEKVLARIITAKH